MPIVRPWRHHRIAAATVLSAVVALVTLVPATPAAAAPAATSIAVTSPSTGKVAANTEKQVVVLTVNGLTGATLSEDAITGVDLGADAACADLPVYVVTSPTTITVKTPTGGCDPTVGTTPETVTIKFVVGNLAKATTNLIFIAPPEIADTNNAPVITENSAGITDADDQIQQLAASGGQYVRIKAADDFTFNGGSAAALSVTIGGRALTEVKAYSATNTILTGPGQAGDVGNYLIGKTATGMTTSTPTVVISQGGVSKTFDSTRTGITIVNAPTITSLNVTVVKAGVATNITVTGTGLASTSPEVTEVTVCGVPATTLTQPNSQGTSMAITVPAAGIIDDVDGLGEGVFSGTCPVVVTANDVASRLHEKSMIAIVVE